MIKSDLIAFIKNTEKMVTPRAVSALFQRAEMLAKLPISVQKFILSKASGKDPFIGFIVEPYSFFLAYEIVDLPAATQQLPPDYELIPCAMFAGTKPRYCAILGIFNIHTSVFWGSRVELYLIAKNRKTGLLSWIIYDYESNTISYDPGQGFSGPSTIHSVVTTSYAGELIVDVAGANSANHIALTADILAGDQCPLNQELWVEGNLSVDYGGHLEDAESKPFGLIFDPKEMVQALNLPLDHVQIKQNTFGENICHTEPYEACCFPFAQHFLTTSFPILSSIQNEQDLEESIVAFNQRTGR